MPSLQQRKYFPQGIGSYQGAIQLTKAIEVKSPETGSDANLPSPANELNLTPERREKIIKAAKNIIVHGKMIQVDGGEYGPNPPTNVWHPKDTKYGSIDKIWI